MSDKTIIEVGGVKMEVDLRYAKRIEELRIGDRVKVLTKVYDGHKVWPGVIVGFEPFQALPTIIVSYVEHSWSDCTIKFLYFNTASKDVELVKAIDDDQLDVSRVDIQTAFERQKEKLRLQIAEIEEKERYFATHFRAYWESIEQDAQL